MKFKNFITDAISYAKHTSDDITSRLDEIDGEFYATAEEEIENGDIDRGLWSKAFVQAKGEESLRKAMYMELRAKQLKVKEVESRKSDKEMNKMLSSFPSKPIKKKDHDEKTVDVEGDSWPICEKCGFVAKGTKKAKPKFTMCPNCYQPMNLP